MANIFEDAWNAGKEWASNTADDVEKYVTKKVIEKKFNDWGSSVTEALGGPTKMTPELEAAGWKLGIDNVPYNANLVYTGDDWARDQANAAADARVQAAATGGATSDAGTTGSSPFKLSQDLRQRTPSGTVYNPDISEYLNSGLFNYTGPGGVPEYTYGQGLPTDGAGYDIWGTPVGPNLYYEGQYGEGYVEPTGPADSAITLPPVTMPDGVPQIPPSNNPNTTTNNNNNGNGNGDKDLNYFETLAAMGINPEDAPSTTFPGPNDKLIEESIMNQNAVKETLPYQSGIDPNLLNSYINEEQGDSNYVNSGINPDLLNSYINEEQGDSNYVNSGINPSLLNSYINEPEGDSNYTGMNPDMLNSYINEAQGDSNYTGMNPSLLDSYINESNVGDALPISSAPKGDFNNLSPIGPSIYDTQYTPVPYQVGGEEQVFDGKPYDMIPSDDGSFNYGANNQANFETVNNIYNPPTDNNIIRNPNEETQPYRGIYVDPRTVPEINDVQSNTTYPPSMPADYDTGSNMNLVTITDKEYEEDVPIVFDSNPLNGPVGTSKYNTDNWINPDDMLELNFNMSNNNDYVPKEQYGLDEAAVDAYKYVTGLFKDDSVAPLQGPAGSTAPSYTGSIETEPSIWDDVMATIAGTAEMPFPANDAVVTDDNFIDLVHSQLPRLTEQESADSLNILMDKMAGGMNTEVDYAPGSSSAIDQIVANSLLQEQAVQPVVEHPGITAKKNLAAKQAEAQAQAQAAAQAQAQAAAQAQAQAAAQAQAQAAAAEKARQAAAAQKRMNDRYETGPVARAPTPAPRPSAPAGGYSTKSVNNNFATRRDIRNIFA